MLHYLEKPKDDFRNLLKECIEQANERGTNLTNEEKCRPEQLEKIANERQ